MTSTNQTTQQAGALKSWTEFRSAITWTVLVAGLGYFVDLFDITIFGVVRVSSLRDIGVAPEDMLKAGVTIYNMQMWGMMLGGIVWGLLADKKGRLSVMFGSIILYSLGNIANAFVWDVNSYAVCRFLTGVGLAGELGAAITLVSESLPASIRGYGTTFVATLGLLGSVCAAYVGQKMNWKVAYISGGVLGLLLLVARLRVVESKMFEKAKSKSLLSSLSLLANPERAQRYFWCIALGMPIYFTTGILFTFSPELTAALGVVGKVEAGNALLFGSIGLTIGDMLSGLIGQLLRSRKKSVFISLTLGFVCSLIYLNISGLTSDIIYALCFIMGVSAGYWAVLVTIAAEQFGTNIRGTVATTVPNFVRGSAIICTLLFLNLKQTNSAGTAAFIVGGMCYAFAFLALYKLRETYGFNLDYTEN